MRTIIFLNNPYFPFSMSNTNLSQQNIRYITHDELKRDERFSLEFDKLVDSYNVWSSKAEPSRSRLNVQSVLRCDINSLNQFGKNYRNLVDVNSELNPIYSLGLSSEQRSILFMASDWKRLDTALEDIVSGKIVDSSIPVDAARTVKEACVKIYSEWRDAYVKSRGYSINGLL